MFAGLYHGSEQLCKSEKARPVQQEVVDNLPVWKWNECIEFQMAVRWDMILFISNDML